MADKIEKYYILLEDTDGIEKKKSKFLLENKKEINELKGGIYVLNSSKDKSANDEFTFTSTENKERSVICSLDKFKEIDRKDSKLLAAIPSKLGRAVMYNSDLYKDIKLAKLNDTVTVKLDSQRKNKVVMAKIRYIGPLKNKKGDYFGVEFDEPIGDCNGIVDGTEYFVCHSKCGSFFSVDKIKSVFKRGDFTNKNVASEIEYDNNPARRPKGSTSLPYSAAVKTNPSEKQDKMDLNLKDYRCWECYKTATDAVKTTCCQKLCCETCVVSCTKCPFCSKDKFAYKPSYIERGMIDKNKKQNAKSSTNKKKGKKQGENENYDELGVGKRVVLFREEKFKKGAIHGTVKFLGQLNEHNDLIEAIVETDVNVGPEPKFSEYQKKVKATRGIKYGYVLVVRPEELMLEELFDKDEQAAPRQKEENVQLPLKNQATQSGGANCVVDQNDSPLYESIEGFQPGNNQPLQSMSHTKQQRTENVEPSPRSKRQEDEFPGTYVSRVETNQQRTGDVITEQPAAGYSVSEPIQNKHKSKTSEFINEELKAAGYPPREKQQPVLASTDRSMNFNFNDQLRTTGFPEVDPYQYHNNTCEPPQENKTQLPNKNESQSKIFYDPLINCQVSNNPVSNQENTNSQFTDKHWVAHNPTNFDKLKIEDEKKKQVADLSTGMMVEVTASGKTNYGVIRFLGELVMKGRPTLVAGLELEDYSKFGTNDGTFQGVRYFDCPKGKGLFVKAKTCKPDKRFVDHAALEPENNTHSNFQEDEEIPLPITGYIPPPPRLFYNSVGKNKGIQGHHNSCYMDSTLFAMFAYSDVFDVALHRKPRQNSLEDYNEVQRLLKENIVNPLRKDGYVSQRSVMRLRKMLEKHATIGGFMTEEKDPEELVVLLFEKVLNLEPFIKLRTLNGNVNNSLLYQIFPPEIDRNNGPPSLQTLLELSLIDSGLFLDEIPSVLALQMPRFGLQKMFDRIFINPQLDLKDFIHRTRYCGICEKPAEYLCKECSKNKHFRNDGFIYLCKGCTKLMHSHTNREKHEPAEMTNKSQVVVESTLKCELELFAVVCINTSHYVSFVKCENDWVFFDSMADRQGTDEMGYNIPEITKLTELQSYLDGTLNFRHLKKKMHDEKNEKLLRFFDDPSLCLYRNKQFIGYQ